MSAAASQPIPRRVEEKTLASAPQSAVSFRDTARRRADFAWIEKIICSDGPIILRMLWKLLGDEQDVLDAYQDCWCSLANLPRPEGLRSAKAFAYRTATNIAIEMIRRKARRRDHWLRVVHDRAERAEAAEANAADIRNDALREAIEALPPHLQNVVILRDLGRMSYAEVSKVLGIEPGTARVYRRQAVVRLAELLEERPTS